jgi:hypothetical protein
VNEKEEMELRAQYCLNFTLIQQKTVAGGSAEGGV